MMANGARLFGFVVTGIVVIGAEHCPCTVRLERTGERTFALEEWRLPNQIGPGDGVAPLQLSGPDAMPVDGLLRSLPALLTGRPAEGDVDFTLLGVATRPTCERTAFVAAVQLRGGAAPSEMRVRLVPDVIRPFGFAWPRDCTVDQWLRALERASRRCAALAGHCGG
ncbi:MAG TPA: hypothetical protein VFQ80_08430 [Thermomicrobiales bacterium]|nr:hypothetical protein [Thermomicrobiales bacterium]